MYSQVLNNVMESNRTSSDAVCPITYVDQVVENSDGNEVIQCSNLFPKKEVNPAITFSKKCADIACFSTYGCDLPW
jgi:hypothetical protein